MHTRRSRTTSTPLIVRCTPCCTPRHRAIRMTRNSLDKQSHACMYTRESSPEKGGSKHTQAPSCPKYGKAHALTCAVTKRTMSTVRHAASTHSPTRLVYESAVPRTTAQHYCKTHISLAVPPKLRNRRPKFVPRHRTCSVQLSGTFSACLRRSISREVGGHSRARLTRKTLCLPGMMATIAAPSSVAGQPRMTAHSWSHSSETQAGPTTTRRLHHAYDSHEYSPRALPSLVLTECYSRMFYLQDSRVASVDTFLTGCADFPSVVISSERPRNQLEKQTRK